MNVTLNQIYLHVMNYMDMFPLYAYFIINIYQRGGIMAYEKDLDDVMYEFTKIVCTGCGWTRWYAEDLEGCECEEE